MLQRIRYLAGQSAIYGVGTAITQGIAFFLIPLYTQYLPPEAFGILAIVSALSSILLAILPLGLPTAALRFYFDTQDNQQQQVIIGSLWLTSLISIVGLAIALLLVGPQTSLWIFPDVPFYPYLLLGVLIALVQALGLLPQALFRAKEQATRYVVFTTGSSLLTTLISIWFVAGLRWATTGALVASLIAPAVASAGATFLLLRSATVRFRPALMKAGFLFGIPLVPASIFGWILRLSDRLVMQPYVSLADIGVYSLGYQIGDAISLLGVTINSAWSPFYYRTFQEHRQKAPAMLAPIITYFALVVIAVALAIAALSPEIIHLLAKPNYYMAYGVVPWVAAGAAMRVLNWIPRQGIMYAKKTYWEPLLSIIGGGVNIGLNLLLLPRVGYIAAAWTTLIGYTLMTILALIISQKVHPIVYEYKRLAILGASALIIFFISQRISLESVGLSLAVKTGLLGLYPVLLWLLGFVSERERKALHKFYAGLRAAPRPSN